MKEKLREFLAYQLCPVVLEKTLGWCYAQERITQWKLLCWLSAECWSFSLKTEQWKLKTDLNTYWKSQFLLWQKNPSLCLHPILKKIDPIYHQQVEKILYEASFCPTSFALKGQRDRWISHLSECYNILQSHEIIPEINRWLFSLILYQHKNLFDAWNPQSIETWKSFESDIFSLKKICDTKICNAEKRVKILYDYGVLLYNTLSRRQEENFQAYANPSWRECLSFRLHSYCKLRFV